MIRAIVVDDEPYASAALQTLLKKHCPDVVVEAACNSAQEAEKRITELKPQLVFLDIEMPHRSGFELLEQFKEIKFSVIFTTSYDQYAIKAIRFSALDYLLKPIDPKELMLAVRKAATLKNPPTSEQLRMLMEQLHHRGNGFTKIAVPTAEAGQFVRDDQRSAKPGCAAAVSDKTLIATGRRRFWSSGLRMCSAAPAATSRP